MDDGGTRPPSLSPFERPPQVIDDDTSPGVSGASPQDYRRWPLVGGAIVVSLAALITGAALAASFANDADDAEARASAAVEQGQQSAAAASDANERAQQAEAALQAAEGRADSAEARARQELADEQARLDDRAAALDQRQTAINELEARVEANSIPTSGTFLVRKDIKPGTYRAPGGANCYWARLSGTTGDLKQIIANGGTAGANVVTIKRSDKAFETDGCGMWQLSR